MSMSTTALECPLCGSTRLEVRHDHSVTYRYLKKDHVLEGQEHTVCLDCEISFLAEGQLERNRELFFAFEKQIVKDIAPREVRELREKYLITQEEATRIFNCGSPTAFSKWERGETAPTGTAALLLRLALEDVATMQKLADRAGVKIDVPTVRTAVQSSVEPRTCAHVQTPKIDVSLWSELSTLLEESTRSRPEHLTSRTRLIVEEEFRPVLTELSGIHFSIKHVSSTTDDTREKIPAPWMCSRLMAA